MNAHCNRALRRLQSPRQEPSRARLQTYQNTRQARGPGLGPCRCGEYGTNPNDVRLAVWGLGNNLFTMAPRGKTAAEVKQTRKLINNDSAFGPLFRRQYSEPYHHDVDQRQEHRSTAHVFRALGQLVIFQRDAIDRCFNRRVK